MTTRLLVDVVIFAEKFLAGLADARLEPLRKIRPHHTDRGIHRVIAGSAIDSEPLDFLLEHPFEKFDFPAGMHAEISNQILFGLTLPIAVPAGVNDQNISVANLDR